MVFKSSATVAAAPPPVIAVMRARPQSYNKAALHQHPSPDQAILIFVSPSTFCRISFALVFAHASCGAFVAGVGAAYVYARGCYIVNAFTLYGVIVGIPYLLRVAAVYFTLAGVHAWLLWGIFFHSLRSRTYSLRRTPNGSIANSSNFLVQFRSLACAWIASRLTKLAAETVSQRCKACLPLLVVSVLGSVWRFLVACLAATSVHSEDYGLFYVMRKMVQSGIQTYQAYRLSCLVPRVWMNNVTVALFVLNCWSTPLIQHVFSANKAKVRLGCALVSVLLDFVSYAVIPIALFLPYLLQFNFDTRDFDSNNWYTDLWLTQMINELQVVFVTSFWDAVSKFAVAVGIIRWLHTITKLVRVTPGPIRQAHSVAPAPVLTIRARGLVNIDDTGEPTAPWKTQTENGAKRVLLLWSCVVLVAHVHASWIPVHPQCLLRTRPWFGSKPSCLLLAYDCWLEKSTGSEEDLDQFLQLFDEARIGYLDIRRCPLLEMPRRLTTLSQLRGLKLYQSSILKWDVQAALMNSRQPEMVFVFLVDVNMTELPQGLLATDFPKKLLDIEMYGSNVSKLPNDLASIWPSNMFLIIEKCQLQETPIAVSSMNARFLSLALNNISSVPAQLLPSASPSFVFLDGNPIQSLPGNLTHTPTTGYLSLKGTQVTALPDWIDEQYLARAMVFAGGTSLCDRMIELSLASKSASGGFVGLDCLWRAGEGPLGWYPIDSEEQNNPTYTLE